MATNPAPFPVPNESPYGDKVQDYIDTGDDAVEAAAKADATSKVSGHTSASNPHTQYARLSAVNTFTANQIIESSGSLFRLINTAASSGQRRWTQMIDNGTGAFQIAPAVDDGALFPAADRFFFFRDRRFRFGGIDQIAGTGNPNGVHASPIGSVFRNTEAGGWNGARVWRKDAGTGNTGWVVESGDTGWRDLSSYLVNGAAKGGGAAPEGGSEAIRIRRVGDTVTFRAGFSLPTWVSGQEALDFPVAGFTTPMTYMPNGYSTSPGVVMQGGAVKIYTTSPTPGARYMWTWITSDPWPTTLPGTPA